MKYKIDPDRTSINGLTITFEPIDPILSTFFRSLKSETFPFYISELIEFRNFGEENTSFIFFHQMDWEDKAEFNQYFDRQINRDEIRIRVYDGKVNFSVMSTKDFFTAFSDYALRLIELHREDNFISKNWIDEMSRFNNILLTKIDQQDLI